MKKTIISVLLALVAAGGLQAQDTLWQKPAPKDNYFNNEWIDTSGMCVATFTWPMSSNAIARRYVSTDTIHVYGIAAMMVIPLVFFSPMSTIPDEQAFLNNRYPADPSLEHCEESLLLFQYHSGNPPTMQQLGDSLPVHALHTPVSYWIMSDRPVVSYTDTFPKPVYERYFSTPQTVYDTFYAGFTQWHEGFLGTNDTLWHNDMRPYLTCLSFDDGKNAHWDHIAAWRQLKYSWPHEWTFYDNWDRAYFIFPILTPENYVDTTDIPGTDTVTPGPGSDTITPGPGSDTVTPGPGTDTTLVRGLGTMERYVAVMPNPARDRATVTSSFGITRIEAYDSRGRLVHTLDPTHTASQPLSLTLDLSAWPRGTYLLRILTPLGPTTRKLLLR